MIAPHKRTPVFSKWKEIARREYGINIRDDRPFGVYKNGKELRINTDHSVVIALRDGQTMVWNKPIQYAGKEIKVSELINCHIILAEVWHDIEGDSE